jgi:hypothetical protein
VPGVGGAALINEAPGGGGGFTTFEPADRPRQASQQPRALLRIVGGDYFTTMGIPVVAGRPFDARDRTDRPPVALVSAGFAKVLAQDGPILGRRVRLAETGQTSWEVVGVVADVQVTALDTESPPVLYLSHLQMADNRLTLVLRTRLDVASVTRQVGAIVKSLDPGVPVYAVATLDQQLRRSKAVFSRELPMILCAVFGAAALAITLVALYAISLHDVLARRREFGIRLALGAAPNAIRRLILKDALLVSTAGIAAGAIIAVLVTRSLQAMLFDIGANDWRVFAIVITGVLAAAMLAIVGPVRRAGAVNLGLVLRAE